MAIENEIRDLQSEVLELRHTNDSLRTTVAVQNQELDTLRVEAVLLRSTSKAEIRRSEAMYTILTQVSAGLISGINRMGAMDKDERRRMQEQRLGVGGDDMPPIVPAREPEPPTPPLRRSKHLGGLYPQEPGDQDLQVMHDLDTDRAYVWRSSSEAWRMMGPPPVKAPEPTPATEPAPAATAGPSRVRSEPIPARSPPEYFTQGEVIMRPKPGTMRTDIIDKRLPPVVLDPENEDQRDLAALAEGILGEKVQ